MKKILLSSIILFLFSVSVVLFQISCKKEAVADVGVNGAGGSNLGVILFIKTVQNDKPNLSKELWTANYDGTNQKKINITVGTGKIIESGFLSPDGKIVFVVFQEKLSNNDVEINTYSCLPDGSNLKRIFGDVNNKIFVCNVY